MKTYRLFTVTSVAAGLLVLFSAVALAAISVGTSSTNISNDVTYTEITLNKPSGTVAGDFLLANLSFKGGTSITTITPPSGWTLFARTDNEDNVGVVSYWKVASSSDPSSWTWNFNVQTRGAGGITPFSDVDTSDPIVAYATSSGRGATATAPSTTAIENSLLISVFAIDRGTNNSGVMSTSTAWTKLFDKKNVGMGPTMMAEYRLETSAGTTSTATTTVSNGATREWAAHQIALRPTIPTFWTLVVGGGGGGGGGAGSTGGGGGAGGYVENQTTSLNPDTEYTIAVGEGGAGGTSLSDHGDDGANSSLGTIVAYGGGGGGAEGGTATGSAGGSGGGGATVGGGAAGGSGTGGQGNDGGASTGQVRSGSGGGGGASEDGDTSVTDVDGDGGDGITSTITGASVTRAGGGGGGGNVEAGTGPRPEGAGGAGGGGAGTGGSDDAGDGTPNTGGGGGGASGSGTSPGDGGDGGSGVVIIRFLTSAITATTSGASCDSVTVSSYTICTWTSTSGGTFEFTEN